MNILVLNGPNLNLLGKREPAVYGSRTYDDLSALITSHCAARGVAVELRQSNHEGVLVDWFQEAEGKFDGIVINPAAYTHTSVALLDAAKAVSVPAVEVHISNPNTREGFRHVSYIRAACVTTICGKGFDGYLEAIDFLIQNQNKR